jgi:hypothetical protein
VPERIRKLKCMRKPGRGRVFFGGVHNCVGRGSECLHFVSLVFCRFSDGTVLAGRECKCWTCVVA